MEGTEGITLSSMYSVGVRESAGAPVLLSIEKVSPPCQTPRRIGFSCTNSSAPGLLKCSMGVDFNTSSINALHIGATMYPAIFFSIGVLSLFPAQAPTEILGV